MNLRSRLRAPEQALGDDLSSFCETCGYPSTAMDLQVLASEDEQHGACAGVVVTWTGPAAPCDTTPSRSCWTSFQARRSHRFKVA